MLTSSASGFRSLFRCTLLYLSGYRPYLRGLDNLCAQQEAVVLVVVGDDDAALLLAGQHKLDIFSMLENMQKSGKRPFLTERERLDEEENVAYEKG